MLVAIDPIQVQASVCFSSSMINDRSMATELPATNGSAQNSNVADSFTIKTGLARMLKGGVIMDVVNAEQVRYPKTSNTKRS